MSDKNIFAKFGDSMMSFLTNLGKKSKARFHRTFRRLSNNILWNLYNSSWVVKKYIDKTAQDMTKKWREIKTNDFSTDNQAKFNKEEDALKIQQNAELALSWASLFGDCLVLAVTDVHDDLLSSPLALESEEIIRFQVIDPMGFQFGDEQDDDIRTENYGNPTHYKINNLNIHHSRVHRMRAGKALFSAKNKDRYGVSDIQAAYDTIKMFDTVSTTVSDLIEEAKVDVLSVEGLNAQISDGKEADVLKYAEVAQQSKSQSNMLLIDSTASYDQKEVSFSGLSDIWVKAGNVLAAALDRPLTILFGQSANGFSSGEEDSQSYYDTINALQESRLRPLLDFFDKFIFIKMENAPSDWKYDFPTIDTINELEESQRFSNYVAGFILLLQANLMKESQILSELKQKGLVENITEKDIKDAESLASKLIAYGTESDTRTQEQAYSQGSGYPAYNAKQTY